MDRLELYYSNPEASQPAGDYIRIRNVYVRSTRAYHAGVGSTAGKKRCRDLANVNVLRRARAPEEE